MACNQDGKLVFVHQDPQYYREVVNSFVLRVPKGLTEIFTPPPPPLKKKKKKKLKKNPFEPEPSSLAEIPVS